MVKNSNTLISQSEMGDVSEGWHYSFLNDLESRLGEGSEFPCVFAKNAFRKGLLKFIFVENIQDDGMANLATGLREYVELSSAWDGGIDTAYPLVIAFSTNAFQAESVREYHQFGWAVLQKLHEVDLAPWPEGVSKDPDSDSWCMCFSGMPLFFNMSSPAHKFRRSRNLGVQFTLIVNPRERFDIFAGDTAGGRAVRSNIRGRIARYDTHPHALQLGTYGSGSAEWWQYGLIEENTQRTDKCPFIFRKK